MTFIVWHKNGTREQYSNRYDEDIEEERDLAWEDVRNTFPNADYIESL